MAANVEIYSKANCAYCDRAKALFQRKQLPYKEIRVDQDPTQLAIMLERSQRRSFPQIFINNQHIGGFDDVYALEQSGELDQLLTKEN